LSDFFGIGTDLANEKYGKRHI
jgi:hypothetical protein